MVEEFLESIFPGLQGASWRITSPASSAYNCFAWAGHDTARWWWPIADDEETWRPPGAETSETIATFVAIFQDIGYSICEDERFELGSEKVALFARPGDRPTHAARQLPNGGWTSKLGALEDIEHDLHALEGSEYGHVVRVLKRPVNA